MRVRGEVTDIAVIARDTAIRELDRLVETYGGRRWRKLKGSTMVEMPDGSVARAEVHWYEAHGVGRRELKIKRLLEP